jgi:hypothetical protein
MDASTDAAVAQDAGLPAMDASTPDGRTSSAKDAGVTGDAALPTQAQDAGDAVVDAASNATDASGPETELIADPNPCGMPVSGSNVDPGLLLDVGQVGWSNLRRSGNRAFAYDGHQAVLWDLTAHTQLLHVDVAWSPTGPGARPFADLHGSTLVVEKTAGNLDVYNGSTGALVTTIATGMPTSSPEERFGLAVDGSYVWRASVSGLRAWSASGSLLVTRPGDYRSAGIFAAPLELRVANGPAGTDVIELIAVNQGTSSTTPQFLAQFMGWFVDGGRFFTTGSVLRVYPRYVDSAAPVYSAPGSQFVGQGDFFWSSAASSLSAGQVYAVNGGSNPILTAGGPVFPLSAGGSTIAIQKTDPNDHSNSVDIVRLDTPSPQTTSYPLPASLTIERNDDDHGTWLAASSDGLLYTSEDLIAGALDAPLGCGNVLDVMGGSLGYVAIASARGLLIAQVTPQAKSVIGRIPFNANWVQLSADGTILAARSWNTTYSSTSLRVWKLPQGERIKDWPYDLGAEGSFSLASTAPVIIRRDQDHWVADDFSGTTQYTVPEQALLAPSGVYSADLHGRIYQSGNLVSGISGEVIGWFDDDRFLVQVWHYGMGGALLTYDRSEIRNVAGQLVGNPMLPAIRYGTLARTIYATDQYTTPEFQTAAADAIYVRRLNSIYDINASTMTVRWSRPAMGHGTLAGNFAVWLAANHHEIRAEAF